VHDEPNFEVECEVLGHPQNCWVSAVCAAAMTLTQRRSRRPPPLPLPRKLMKLAAWLSMSDASRCAH